MAIYRYVSFNQIKWDVFISALEPYRVQSLTNRAVTLEYIPNNNDYDVLKKSIDRDFYKLPYIVYSVLVEDRIDNIAYTFYKDPDYWWVLMLFNKLIDPFTLDVPTLNIPQSSKLFLYLTRKKMEYRV